MSYTCTQYVYCITFIGHEVKISFLEPLGGTPLHQGRHTLQLSFFGSSEDAVLVLPEGSIPHLHVEEADVIIHFGQAVLNKYIQVHVIIISPDIRQIISRISSSKLK